MIQRESVAAMMDVGRLGGDKWRRRVRDGDGWRRMRCCCSLERIGGVY